MQQPAVDVGFMNNELLDLEVNAPVFISKLDSISGFYADGA